MVDYSSTFKICLNKAGLSWRVLVYELACIVLIAGLGLAVAYQFIADIVSSGFGTSLETFTSENLFNFSLSHMIGDFAVLSNEFWAIIGSNLLAYLPSLIALFVVCWLLGSVFCGLVELPVCECIYGYMGSLAKLNFAGYFISDFWRGIKFRLCKLLITFLFDLTIIASFFGLLQLTLIGGVVSKIAPFVIVLIMFAFVVLRQALFAEWGISVVAKNCGIWQGLRNNFRLLSKNLRDIFGGTTTFVLIAFVVNYLVGILTCLVGLLITIPFTIVCFNVLYLVIYFKANGLRFYVDRNTIVTSKKIEDNERINEMRYII